MYRHSIKGIIDRGLAFVLLILLSPLMLLVAVTVWMTMGRPIFFLQARPGLREKIFTIYKFRTMNEAKDINGALLCDEQRLKGFGKFVRSTSLDELPQLLNILKGEMSFIGPRPLLAEYLPLYSERQKVRHSVKPGITGWAQVNGRNAISWEEKFELDVWYVEHLSFWMDMKIMWMTLMKVLKRSDIDSNTYVTMEKFKGDTSNGSE